MFSSGDKVYNVSLNKYGIIINLRNDTWEKKMREQNQSHYYYHIYYDDNTFDTYVSTNCLIKYKE